MGYKIRKSRIGGIISPMFENIRIVLVNPSHPGNIGAAARAMKNMGFSRLYLVQPELFPYKQATARAAGADAILATAREVADDLKEALTGCNLVYYGLVSVPVLERSPGQSKQRANVQNR